MKVNDESGKVGLKFNINKTKIMASSPITSWKINGETVADFIFLGSNITADGDCNHEIKRCLLLGWKDMTNLDSILKSRHYFANKGPSSQGYGFSSDHVWMWELDREKSWVPKNWCFWTVVLEKTLESLGLSRLDCKEIQSVHPKGNQFWIFIGRIDPEAEAPILWPPDVKNWLNGKDPDTGKDWKAGQEEDSRGWDGWMASPTRWTWVCVNPGSWWWTGRPGVLQSMGSQKVRHDWATELNSSFLGGAVVKNLPASARDVGLIPGSGRSPGVGNNNPLLYSCLENSIDRGVRWATYSP